MHDRPAPRSPPDLLAAGLAVLLLALTVARLLRLDFHWLMWADRDLTRSMAWAEDWPTVGAEMSHGADARIPGGAWHLLLGLPFALRGEPDDAWRFFLVLDALGAVLLGWGVARAAGRWAGLVAAAVFLGPTPVRGALALLCNPLMMPLFLGAAHLLLGRALDRGSRAAWAGWAWALAIAAQGHFLGLVWLGACLVGLVLLRPRDVARGLPWVGLALALAYGPYLVDDAARGWPNSRAVLGMDPLTKAGGSGLTFEPGDLGAGILHLLPDAVPGVGGALLGAIIGGLAVVGLLSSGRGPAWSRDLLRVQALALAANLAVPALEGEIGPDLHYVLPALPALAALVGVGAAAVAGALGSARTVVAAGITVLVAVGAALDLARLARPPAPPDIFGWEGRRLALEALRERFDEGWAGVAGRTFFAAREGEGWAPTRTDGMDWLLREEGVPFPGSLPPPCAAVLATRPSDPPPRGADVARALGWSPEGFAVLEHQAVSAAITAVIYTPPGDRCPTLATDRYLDTPVEAQLRPLDGQLPNGVARALDAPDGVRRFAVALKQDDPTFFADVLAAVDLAVMRGGLVAATLHSGQLRGASHSHGGWLRAGLLSDVDVVLVPEGGGAPVVLPIATGPIGLNGILAPLRSGATAVGTGRWTASLRATVHDVSHGRLTWPVPPSATARMDVELGEVVLP